MTTYTALTWLRKLTKANGGATFLFDYKERAGFVSKDFTVDEPLFVVGGVTQTYVVDLDTWERNGTDDRIADVFRTARALGADGVGTWVENAFAPSITHKVHLDVIDTYANLDKALRVARERGEQEIFNLFTMEEILVTAPDEFDRASDADLESGAAAVRAEYDKPHAA